MSAERHSLIDYTAIFVYKFTNMKNLLILIGSTLISLNAWSQTRIVLLEQFSNSGCPPCATYTPGILNYASTNPDKIAAISYHTAYPYLDSMYYENPIESDARVDFYGSFGVPYSILDGNYYRNNSANLSANLNQTVTNRLSVASRYEIKKINTSIQERTLNGVIQFKSLNSNNTNENLRAFVVVVEKRVEKSDYKASPGNNSEQYYSFVMRKFMTDVNGNILTNKNTGETTQIEFNWNIINFKNISELRIIAFVQNIDTKEIYQSIMIDPFESPTGVENEEQGYIFKIYPNPSKSDITIEVENNEAFELLLYNSLGKLIDRKYIHQKQYEWHNLTNGIYILKLIQGKNVQTEKIIIRN